MLTAEEIYDAVLDQEAFDALPGRIAAATGGRSVLIHWHFADGGAEVMAHSGYFTDAQLRTYAQSFAAMDPWAAATAGRQLDGRALNLEQVVATPVFVSSAFYNEFVRAIGDDTGRCMGLRANAEWGAGMVAVQRGLDQPGFSEAEVAELDGIGRHLQRLLYLRGRLAWHQHRRANLDAIFSALSDATVLLDTSGRVLSANPAAETLFGAGTELAVRNGRITVPGCQRTAARLRAAVAAAAAPSFATSELLLEAGLVLTLSPIGHGAGSRILLLARRSAASPPGAERTLRQVFKLTASEAQVALMLAEGMSVAAISEARGVSAGTVRVQLKTIFSKLDCTRQVEAVALVQGLPRLANGAG